MVVVLSELILFSTMRKRYVTISEIFWRVSSDKEKKEKNFYDEAVWLFLLTSCHSDRAAGKGQMLPGESPLKKGAARTIRRLSEKNARGALHILRQVHLRLRYFVIKLGAVQQMAFCMDSAEFKIRSAIDEQFHRDRIRRRRTWGHGSA